MAIDSAWLKAHWYYIAAGLVGLFVVYEILSSASSSSASTTSGTSSSDQLQSLQASADLNDAQYNAQVETASYAADVANNQTEAELQLGEVQTAAELEATQGQTSAAEDTAKAYYSDSLAAQEATVNGQVQETQIEGDTIDTISGNQTKVQETMLNNVNNQIDQLFAGSKHFSSDIQAFSPVIAEETGQGSSAGSVKPAANSTTAQNISATGTAVSSTVSSLSSLAALALFA